MFDGRFDGRIVTEYQLEKYLNSFLPKLFYEIEYEIENHEWRIIVQVPKLVKDKVVRYLEDRLPVTFETIVIGM